MTKNALLEKGKKIQARVIRAMPERKRLFVLMSSIGKASKKWAKLKKISSKKRGGGPRFPNFMWNFVGRCSWPSKTDLLGKMWHFDSKIPREGGSDGLGNFPKFYYFFDAFPKYERSPKLSGRASFWLIMVRFEKISPVNRDWGDKRGCIKGGNHWWRRCHFDLEVDHKTFCCSWFCTDMLGKLSKTT